MAEDRRGDRETTYGGSPQSGFGMSVPGRKPGDWIPIPIEVIAQVDAFTHDVDGDQKSSRYDRPWNPRRHFIGDLAQYVYAQEYGLPWTATRGVVYDGGHDFGPVDVKGSPYLHPDLLRPVDAPLVAEWYALVTVDVKNRRGRVHGHGTRQQYLDAEIVDLGHGPSRKVPRSELRPVAEGVPA